MSDDPLAVPGEDDAVIADDRAAAQAGEADVALAPCAGHPVAAPRGVGFQRDAATGGGRLAQHQGGARGRVDLHPMVHLDDFNVEFIAERGGGATRERRQEVDAEAHIAGADDRRMPGGGVDPVEIILAEPGRPDHMGDARLGRERSQFDGGGRR